ncbi:hypothetical protein HMPREF0972_01927 [Actinomyces sp. oral taxon 848 str. F0332]|nr:hypothetical protein HMPREF0972_01927 [Actinomyces sp. oral taxon 848 str. F0332]
MTLFAHKTTSECSSCAKRHRIKEIGRLGRPSKTRNSNGEVALPFLSAAVERA